MSIHRHQSLLTDNISAIIWRNSLPMLGAILALFAYELFESSLMALNNASTLTALGFTIPITITMAALAIGTSIRCNNKVVKSACLKKDNLSNTISIALIKSNAVILALALLLFLLSEPLLNILGNGAWLTSQTATNADLILAQQNYYLNARYFGWIFLAIIWQVNGTIRALGFMSLASKLMMSWLAVKAFLALILLSPSSDYFQGAMEGAAIAHSVSDLLFSLISLIVLHKKVPLRLPSKSQILQSCHQATTTSSLIILQQLVTPISIALLTIIAARVDHSLVAAFALIFRIEALLLLLPMILTTSMPAIVGINFWSGHYKRARQALSTAFIAILICQTLLAIILVYKGDFFAALLCPQSSVIKHIDNFFILLPWGYIGAGCVMLYQSCLNAKGRVVQATWLGIMHRLLLLVPLTWLGSLISDDMGLFQGLMLSHLGAGFVTLFIFLKKTPNTAPKKYKETLALAKETEFQ